MTPSVRRRLAAGFLAMFLAVPPASAAAETAPATVSPATTAPAGGRAQLRRLLDRLSRSRHRLREVKRAERRVLSALEDIDRSREATERRLAELAQEQERSKAEVQKAATHLADLERRLAAHRARLGGRLRTIYLYGRTGYVDVLLGAGDVGEFVTRWQFLSTIVGADARLIREYAEDVEESQAWLAVLRQQQARLAAVAAETEARRREVVAEERAKRTVLARLQEERAAFERMVAELEEDSRQLEALIRRSQGAPRSVALARSLAGFIWPARGVFTSGFGIRRHPIFRIRRMHTGQDIAAPYGSPVLAAGDGRVIYTGWFGGYGKIVVLDHGDGLSTLYAHLSAILVGVGQAVRRGQVVGRIGSTGYSTGPHVHFEVRVQGRPIDPARR
ncbi:MAG: peptidoglycan DD-metalloendopeptidase family protein [Armatimonadota bacterium]|nr:peptidoglycan DD-metalloendopeptidase family protein [Armatimonadota bacterium]MDR7452399.1 peptidoglycan DD-metalloendopeptidase family protein [Armatimonadota bacterium]MDR7466744.1 peptidoglycan DD-metalloendopeptidase family protein [Armatimonadota bacterium]MDR7492782.1 peptidoglycan DD-metalloendopeptidase family protein [Armatimonadota bacterium]MDR7498558.1 peptidoglycan DD-metalloendopeptidase family protein [Armatimonadota bacterium]